MSTESTYQLRTVILTSPDNYENCPPDQEGAIWAIYKRNPEGLFLHYADGAGEGAAADGATEARTSRTQFFDDARHIDTFRASNYWSLKHEMLARAFAAYVSDRLRANGERSDYLVHAADNRYYVLLDMKPFPEGEERARFNAAFDTCFTHYRQPGIAFTPTPLTTTDMARYNPLKISSVIAEVNAAHTPPGGWTDADKVPPPGSIPTTTPPAPKPKRATVARPAAVAPATTPPAGGYDVAVKTSTHTKRQCPIWIARLSQRVDKAEFLRVLAVAKQHGGYWSSFGPADQHGFIFFSAQEAQQFKAIVGASPDAEGVPSCATPVATAPSAPSSPEPVPPALPSRPSAPAETPNVIPVQFAPAPASAMDLIRRRLLTRS